MRVEGANSAHDDGVSYEEDDVLDDVSSSTYPLNMDEYKRLKLKQGFARRITQTVVPALCDVDVVEISEHELATIPLKPGLSGDPMANELLAPGQARYLESED